MLASYEDRCADLIPPGRYILADIESQHIRSHAAKGGPQVQFYSFQQHRDSGSLKTAATRHADLISDFYKDISPLGFVPVYYYSEPPIFGDLGY